MDIPEEMPQCSVGLATQDICHQLIYCRKAGIIASDELSLKDTKVLEWRVEISLPANDTICNHHEKLFISRYESLQKNCCDPFDIHNHHVCFYVMFSKLVYN